MRIVLIYICLIVTPALSRAQYHFYFGNLHAHSSYSDGNKDSISTGYYTPGDNYNYAKQSYHMDFLGISDHNHYSANNNPGMHVADYAKGLYQADTANKNGTFVCLYGFEWGVISSGGHVITYGVPGLIGWETGNGSWGPVNNYDIFCERSDYGNYWPLVKTFPNAFCTLAHPQTGDYDALATTASYNINADSVISGVAIRSGSANSTTTDYSDPAPTLYQSTYFRLLSKGYHVAPNADQDNHYTTFGRVNRIRTVVLAGSLHRDSIMAAYKARRFYASDDWNTEVTFTVNGNFMGSNVVLDNNATIHVSVQDPDAADAVTRIELYYGSPGSGILPIILNSVTGSNTLDHTHTLIAGDNFYYFAKIIQADGDMVWTSPVWVQRSGVVLPITITKFTGRLLNEVVQLNWQTITDMNADHFEIERSADGLQYQRIGSVLARYGWGVYTDYDLTDNDPLPGLNFYRLKIVGRNGDMHYSAVTTVSFRKPLLNIIKVQPNPVSTVLTVHYNARISSEVSCSIYTAEGRLVRQKKVYVSAGNNNLTEDVSSLASGTYFIVMSIPDQRIAETRFIKQ